MLIGPQDFQPQPLPSGEIPAFATNERGDVSLPGAYTARGDWIPPEFPNLTVKGDGGLPGVFVDGNYVPPEVARPTEPRDPVPMYYKYYGDTPPAGYEAPTGFLVGLPIVKAIAKRQPDCTPTPRLETRLATGIPSNALQMPAPNLQAEARPYYFRELSPIQQRLPLQWIGVRLFT